MDPSYCASVSGAGNYLSGTEVTTAYSGMGSGCTFIGWTISSTTAYGQGCADSLNECVFTMNSDIDVEYRFTYTPPATPTPVPTQEVPQDDEVEVPTSTPLPTPTPVPMPPSTDTPTSTMSGGVWGTMAWTIVGVLSASAIGGFLFIAWRRRRRRDDESFRE